MLDNFVYGIKVNNQLKQAVKSGVKVFSPQHHHAY